MSLSMYHASIPMFTRVLSNLTAVLAKGAAHAEARKFDPAVLLGMRLAPDMFPLTRQVQICSDITKAFPARITGADPPSWPDEEASFGELEARLRKTVEHLGEFSPAQIDGSEDRVVRLKIRGDPVSLAGRPYLFHFVLPNLLFHATTTYAILRHAGVELGKRDFLGWPL